jgi:hypothetical protein
MLCVYCRVVPSQQLSYDPFTLVHRDIELGSDIIDTR